MKIIKVGLIQMRCVKNPEKNLKNALNRIQKLAKKGVQIICLPELFRSRYFCQTENKAFFALAEKIPNGPTTEVLSKTAKKFKIVIIASIYEKTAHGKFFNTAVVIDADGSCAGKYRKIHIPDDLKNHYGEAFYFNKGDLGLRVFKTKYAKVGVMICWDQWFPEGARIAALKGAQILFYPTAIGFPIRDPKSIRKMEYEAWQTIQRAHSIANNIFVAAVNRVGLEDQLNFWGTSFVSDPYGRFIAKAPSDRETDLIADCDFSLIQKMREDWHFLEARRIKI